MSWQSDALDGAFDVEQDKDLEDFEETESSPVQKKMKNASKRCRQAEEKPRVRHVLNKAEQKHVVTRIAMIKDVFLRTGLRMSCLVSFSESILPYACILS